MTDPNANQDQSLAGRLGRYDRRVREIDALVAQPDVAGDPARMAALMRERGRLMSLVNPYRRWQEARQARREAEALREAETDDPEMRSLAETEARVQGDLEQRLLSEMQERLIDREEGADASRVILEIRAGTGGDEAALFARDLFQMYARYADARGWRHECLSASPTNLGGFKEILMAVEGENVYRCLRFESGGHRVQRVPETEAQGRIHTSAATVAVMPEPEQLDIQIRDDDLEVDTMRASGPGGQSVNKTSSAVRMKHRPTGITVSMQDEKSQHRNREKARRILTARVWDHYESERRTRRAAERKSKVGSGDRSQRVRTYNFPQNRVTDHRIGYTAHNLDQVMQGDLDALVGALLEADRAEKLAELTNDQ